MKAIELHSDFLQKQTESSLSGTEGADRAAGWWPTGSRPHWQNG